MSILPRFIYLDLRLNVIPPIPAPVGFPDKRESAPRESDKVVVVAVLVGSEYCGIPMVEVFDLGRVLSQACVPFFSTLVLESDVS